MIGFDKEKRIFKLDTENTSYIFGVEDDFGYLIHYYYGPKLAGNDVSYLARTEGNRPSERLREKCSFLDYAPMEYPVAGAGDFRETAFEAETEEGHNTSEFSYVNHKIYKGKKKLLGLPATFGSEEECESLDIVLEDKLLNLRITLTYSVFEGLDAIARSLEVTNFGSEKSIYITKIMSTCLDVDNDDYSILTLHGSWARERRIEYRKLGHGNQGVSSLRGESSHQESPFIALTSKNISQTEGEVYGFSFVYSGNFTAGAYLDQFNKVRVTMGINPYHFRWKLAPGETFTAPEVISVYSGKGLGHMTRTFHDLYRKHLIRSPYKNKKRPILINNWEATYFNFNTEKLLAIAKEAAKLGIEMLVMDDGWFGKRNDDNSSLGDWCVNEEKLPGGLKPLVDGVNALGLKFGIWMEPEMICPDSDLYRAHPDWAIQVPGRTPTRSRNQLVLDLTREEVWEHTWNSVRNTLKSANIEYLKWDMNRQLTDLGSLGLPADRQGELFHRYMLAVYRMQEALITEFPNLLLENCSGGGARFDAGMLYYSPQIWTSDDADAVERLKIQEGTALVFPLSTMGAHVSDCPNHAVGRVTPFKTRGDVALAGTFGYELDVTRIPEADRNMIPEQCATYHKYNDLVREGDYYRLASYSENSLYDAWMVKAKDDSEILVTYVNVTRLANYKDRFLKLQGLDAGRSYRDEETGRVYAADVLMHAGIPMEQFWGDNNSKLVHLVEIK